MNEVQRKVAEQIGMLVIANAEQAVQIEQMQAKLQALQPAAEQRPQGQSDQRTAADLPTMGRQE